MKLHGPSTYEELVQAWNKSLEKRAVLEAEDKARTWEEKIKATTSTRGQEGVRTKRQGIKTKGFYA